MGLELKQLKILIIFILTAIFLSPISMVLSDPIAAGKSALKRGDYSIAFRAFSPLANEGNAEAQTHLGNLYERGLGVLEDKKAALIWYEKAGRAGNPQGQHNTGIFYYEGRGVIQDYPSAYEWFLRATDNEYPPSQYMLGLMYHQGQGVAVNFERARLWFLKAAKQGYANAQFMYSFMLQAGEGEKSNPPNAMVWALVAEKNGKKNTVAITVPASMTMTELEITAAEKIANECFQSNYQNCPE